MVKFIAIAALGKNREIGLEGKLPWTIPSEAENYQKIIQGQHVLIGRKNFELHGGEIKGSTPLVLTKNPDYTDSQATIFHSMEEVMSYAEKEGIQTIFVIGGAEIYDLTLPYLSEFYCSVVDYEGPADSYFPQYLSYEWEMVNSEIHEDWTLYHMKKRPDF